LTTKYCIGIDLKKKYPATLVDLSIDKVGDAIPKGVQKADFEPS
jgi:hypothetical protein